MIATYSYDYPITTYSYDSLGKLTAVIPGVGKPQEDPPRWKRPMPPEDIVSMRKRAAGSQAAFARLLGVSPQTVRQWERGERKPSRTAEKLLWMIRAYGIRYLK